MHQEIDIKEMSEKISSFRQNAQELKEMGAFFPALERNMVRIMASIKMLEINISDVMDSDYTQENTF